MPSFIDKTGAQQEVTLSADIFRAAHDSDLTVRQYINTQYPTCSETETFVQMLASEKMFFKADPRHGTSSTPLRVILDPPISKEAANVSSTTPVQSRILFPAAILSLVESAMMTDRLSPITAFNRMIAITTVVNSARVEQPVLTYSGLDGPEQTRAQQISQLSLPAAMLTITAADRTRTIPTFSLGLAISDQAMAYTSLDLVGLAITRQKEVEMFLRAGESVLDMINGDLDNGQSALAAVEAKDFDALVTTAGTISHKAWISWLYSSMLTRRIDYVIVDSVATAMAIENRAGRPVVVGDNPSSSRIDTVAELYYPSLAANVKIFVAPSEWGLPASSLLGIQSNAAIAKLVNSSADYQSSERWALRRGEAIRFDFGEVMYRLDDNAFSYMTLTV
jgi:hypothetical protein